MALTMAYNKSPAPKEAQKGAQVSYELTEQDIIDSDICRKADKAFRSYRRLVERAVEEAYDEAYRYGGVPPWVDEEFAQSQARAGLALTKALKALASAQGMSLSEFLESERGLCSTEVVNVVTEYIQLLKARREELQELEERRKHLLGCIKGWEEF